MFDAGKNYKVLKTANKVTVTKGDEDPPVFTVSKKRYDGETGAELDDYVVTTTSADTNSRISSCTDTANMLIAEKEDWEELKADMEAL